MQWPEGFCDLGERIPQLIIDARYATENNLTGKPLNGYDAPKAVGTLALCEALKKAAAEAGDLRLRIFDAYRPERAVADLVSWAQAPEDGKTKAYYPHLEKNQLIEEGYIASKSGHSRGSTVDLTLDGLDMGTDFDLMDNRSHHGAQGLTPEQAMNRERLKEIMIRAGFCPYSKEWWHYRLAQEPYPDRYFDFPIR